MEELPYKNLSLQNMEGEEWKWIEGYENRYQVSNMGRIKSFLKEGLPLIKRQGEATYLQIGLCKAGRTTTFLVHRLVGKYFVLNPNNYPQINHLFANKYDNRATQLEWGTQKQNIIHAFAIGVSKINEDHGKAKLTNDQVLDIFQSKEKRKDLSKKYNVALVTIKNIKLGKIWSKVTGKDYKRAENKTRKGLTNEDVLYIYNSTLPNKELAAMFNISTVSVSNIKIGKRWAYLTNKKYIKNRT